MRSPFDPYPLNPLAANVALMTWLRRHCRPLYHAMHALVWSHEIWHYLAARLAGCAAYMELDRGQTLHAWRKVWQVLFIALAPWVVGLFAGMVSLLLAFQVAALRPRTFLAVFGATMLLGWTAVCGDDLRRVVRLVRARRHWRRYELLQEWIRY